MKKSIKKSVSLFLAAVLFLVQTQAYAYAFYPKADEATPVLEAALFQLDEAALEAALQEVNQLEAFLDQHVGYTYEDVLKKDASLLSNYNEMEGLLDGQGPLGIPSFIWGCVLGWVGILIVYLVTEDNEETKRALYGCIVGSLVGILIYAIFIGAWFSAAKAAY